jgi:hypothetical protein
MYGAVPNLEPVLRNISDILAAADMYGLIGLKESVSYSLRRYFCHFFHKVQSRIFKLIAANVHLLAALCRLHQWSAFYSAPCKYVQLGRSLEESSEVGGKVLCACLANKTVFNSST